MARSRKPPPGLFQLPPATEKEWQKAVIVEAKKNGWLYYHPERAMVRNHDGSVRWLTNGVPGFPDLVLVKPPTVLFLELKRDRKSQPTDAQVQWVTAIQACSQVEAYVVSPMDAPDLFDLLRSP